MFLEKLGSLQPANNRRRAEFERRLGGAAKLLFLLTLTSDLASAQISPPPNDQRPGPRLNANGADPLRLESPEVSGRVDASLSPNVEQVLRPQYHIEIERRHSQLVITNRKVRRIAITDSTIANFVQYSESEISIVGLELGRTDLTLWFEDQDAPAIYEITVVRDASLEEQRTVDFGRLERRLKTLYPNSIVALIPVASQVIVRGQAYDGEEAANIMQVVRTEVIRSLRRGAATDDDLGLTGLGGGGIGGAGGGPGAGGNNNQGQSLRDIVINELVVPGEYNISLRVMVAEINRSELRNAGVDWRVLFNGGSESVGSTLGGGAGTTLSGIFENGEIEIFIKWLQSNGTIKLLAEPRLTVLSGTGASILAGGEFAVPTIIGLGGGQATTFRGFGTSLVVTPTVIDRDLIRMQVVPEFSEVNAQNAVQGIPGTNVKRVQTTVELREGQTFAIGGLISRQSLAEVSRVPLLGDIPWLGPRIFQSKSASETETELLVLVSPEIVRPMDPDDVPPVPGYNVTHPSDDELWKRGQTEGIPDHNLYQVAPFGGGSMRGMPQGYSLTNPPQTEGPWPQQPYGIGYSQPMSSAAPLPQYAPQQYAPQQYAPPQYSQPSMSYPPQGYAQPPMGQQPYTLQPPAGVGQPYGSVPPVPAAPRSSAVGPQMGPLPPPLPPQSRVGGVPSRTASGARPSNMRPSIKPAGWHQQQGMNRAGR